MLFRRILIWSLFLAGLALALAGCSWPNLLAGDTPTTSEQVQQREKEKDHQKSPEPEIIQVAEPTPGQRDNTLLAPRDYGQKNEAISNTLTELIESLKMNNLEDAKALLHGLDEAGGAVTLEELQREMEVLHPVAWHLGGCRPVGLDGALVTVSFVWPDGTKKQVQPFSVLNTEGRWTVHFNSFAASFHATARHMIKDQ